MCLQFNDHVGKKATHASRTKDIYVLIPLLLGFTVDLAKRSTRVSFFHFLKWVIFLSVSWISQYVTALEVRVNEASFLCYVHSYYVTCAIEANKLLLIIIIITFWQYATACTKSASHDVPCIDTLFIFSFHEFSVLLSIKRSGLLLRYRTPACLTSKRWMGSPYNWWETAEKNSRLHHKH